MPALKIKSMTHAASRGWRAVPGTDKQLTNYDAIVLLLGSGKSKLSDIKHALLSWRKLPVTEKTLKRFNPYFTRKGSTNSHLGLDYLSSVSYTGHPAYWFNPIYGHYRLTLHGIKHYDYLKSLGF